MNLNDQPSQLAVPTMGYRSWDERSEERIEEENMVDINYGYYNPYHLPQNSLNAYGEFGIASILMPGESKGYNMSISSRGQDSGMSLNWV